MRHAMTLAPRMVAGVGRGVHAGWWRPSSTRGAAPAGARSLARLRPRQKRSGRFGLTMSLVMRDAFSARLSAAAAEVEALLARLLSDAPAAGETARPRRLIEALRHAAPGGGGG